MPQFALSGDATLVSSVSEEIKEGPDVIILKVIADRLNARLEIKHAPFKRRLQLMKDGEIDLIPGLLKRPERETYIHYLLPPYKDRSDTVFFTLKEKTALIKKYEDLYPLKIGTNPGTKYFPQFDDDAKLHKEVVSSSVANFKKLLMMRIDTIVSPESAGIDLVHQMGIGDRVAMADYRFARTKHVYIGVSKKSPLMEKIDAVEAIVRSLVESGEIKKIIVDYYLSHGLPVPAH